MSGSEPRKGDLWWQEIAPLAETGPCESQQQRGGKRGRSGDRKGDVAASQCGQRDCRGAEGQTVRALVAQQGLVNGGASQGELNLEVAADRDWRPCAPAPTSLTT